jgi:predicted GNAT family acetyltransferase
VDRLHPLENLIWHSLSANHMRFAEGNALALRYLPEIGPLAAVREQSPGAYKALAELLGPEEVAVLFLDAPPQVPEGWRIVLHTRMEQMVLEGEVPASEHGRHLQELCLKDVPEMVALARLTEPGPFRERTIELGGYYGLREPGRLVAMAGQRTNPPGFVEVSAVCTHPDFRGRGYAQLLVSSVARAIVCSGQTPFLHVRQENTTAIRVYQRLGFRSQRSVDLLVLKRTV